MRGKSGVKTKAGMQPKAPAAPTISNKSRLYAQPKAAVPLAISNKSQLYAQLILLFLLTQGVGLFTGDKWIVFKEQGLVEQPVIVNENPEDVQNSFGIVGYILVFTLVLLAIIKFAPEWLKDLLFRLFEALATVFASWVVFIAILVNDLVALAVAVLLVVVRNVWRRMILLRNFAAIVTTAGAGSFLGFALGVFPVIVLLVLLSIYDFIAVFKTKHMVTLANAMTKKNLSFTYALPTKEHTFELGTGDMVVPLTFAVSVLGLAKQSLVFPYYWSPPLLILLASLLGLLFTIDYSSKHVGTALPALPLQSICMIVMFGLMKFFGVLP